MSSLSRRQRGWTICGAICAGLALPPASLAGDLSAKTADGREVVLREDGTWIFKPAPVGYPVTVHGVKLTLGAPLKTADYGCRPLEGQTIGGVPVLGCTAGGKPVQLAVAGDGVLFFIHVESNDVPMVRAFEAANVPGLGKMIGETEIDGSDCPEGISRYKVNGLSVEVVVSDGCYEEENPTVSRSLRLIR